MRDRSFPAFTSLLGNLALRLRHTRRATGLTLPRVCGRTLPAHPRAAVRDHRHRRLDPRDGGCATLEAIRQDPARAGDWAAYEAANQRRDQAITAGGAPDDPRFIHTDALDDAVEIDLSVYNRLFNEELGAGGWDHINTAHYANISRALDAHAGEGKRFLITHGAGHKGWFLRHLRQRDDIVLLDVGRFLDQLAPVP